MTDQTDAEHVSAPAAKPATPVRETFSREYVEELREEAKNVRLKASEYKSQLEEQAAQNATKIAETEAKLSEVQVQARNDIAFARVEALAVKAGIVDSDALALLDRSQLVFDDKGKLTNAAEVLEAFKTAKPHFFGSANTSNPEKPPRPAETGTKTAKDLSDKEWQAWKKANNI